MSASAYRIAAAFLLAFLSVSKPAIPADLGEYEVKAAFLVNFTHFIEWPAGSLSGNSFEFCIVGTDPFGSVLEKVVGQRTVKERPISIKRLAPNADLSQCRIAFLNDMDRSGLSKAIGSLEQVHALTVGDSKNFAERQGVVGFVIENERVSLALNIDHANHAGLKINSQLLRVAHLVQSAGKEGAK